MCKVNILKDFKAYLISKSPAFKIMLALFSLAFTKSIFIFPFTFIKGIPGALFGIVLWIMVFVICVIALYFLNNIAWEYKKALIKRRRILLYMTPQIVFNLILLAAFFPGKMSWDSMYIWNTTVVGEYTNLHPLTYTLFVDYLNNIVDSPWIVIIVQFVYASFAFAYTGYVFEGMGLNKKLCWLIVLALMLYPVNFHQNVTMLKDVPYMISLVLISAVMLKTITDGEISFGKLAALFAVSLIALFSRHNALLSVPVGLVILIIYFLVINKNKISALKITALLAAVMACFFATKKITETIYDGDYWRRDNITDVMMMPSAQCSYTILKNIDTLPDDLRTQAERFFNIDYIYYQRDTYSNWEFNNRPLDTLKALEVSYNKIEFLRFYLDMLKAYPKDMMFEYQQITGIIWAIPNYGYTLYYNVGIAEFNGVDIPYTPLFPKLGQFLDRDIKIVFWLRPALWLMLSILLMFASSGRHGMKGLCLIAPMIANAVMFFAGTPAQNVRYFYCNFSIFVIMLAFTLMKIRRGDVSNQSNI